MFVTTFIIIKYFVTIFFLKEQLLLLIAKR